MYICEICGKKVKEDLFVWYGKGADEETNLCRSHYIKWCKHHKPYTREHEHITSCTEAWTKMCNEEQVLFNKWLKEEKETELIKYIKG